MAGVCGGEVAAAARSSGVGDFDERATAGRVEADGGDDEAAVPQTAVCDGGGGAATFMGTGADALASPSASGPAWAPPTVA